MRDLVSYPFVQRNEVDLCHATHAAYLYILITVYHRYQGKALWLPEMQIDVRAT